MKPLKHAYNAEDIISQGVVTLKEIEELRVKLQGVHVPPLTDEQVLQFIISCEHDLDFTITTIKEYFSAHQNGPELFNNRSLNNPALLEQLNVVRAFVFPKRRPDGCAVLFHNLKDTCYSHYQMEAAMKIIFMLIDSSIYDQPPMGLVILFDMKGVNLMHLTRVKIGAIRKFCHYLQEGLPVKLQEIHVINAAYFIDKVMLILKPFLKKELMHKLHFHFPAADDSYYEKILPKDCLPKNLGGDLPDVDEMHQTQIEKFKQMSDYFETEEKVRKDFYDTAKP